MVLKEADAEANEVLTKLRLKGVNVRLEGEDRNKAIKVIESFLKRYKNCRWHILIWMIAGAIQREILKSMNVIDVNMVTQVVDYLKEKEKEKEYEKEKHGSSSDEETDSDEKEKEYNWKDEPDRYLGSDEEEEDSGFEDDSEEDEVKKKKKDGSSSDEETDSYEEKEYNWKDEPDRYLGSDEEEEDSGFEDDSEEDEAALQKVAEAAEARAKQEIEYLHEPTRRKEYIEDLIRLAEKKGLSLKKGDENEIFEMMIPYILGGRIMYYYDDSMERFLRRVKEHIDRCSSLDNVDTIKAALESEDFSKDDRWKIIEQNDSNATREEEKEEDMAHAKDQVNHSLNKTVVPTKEEGVTTPMHQIKQGENGDIMEFEEQETLSPLNLPKSGKESAASAYSSIKESLDRAAANKRKLAQIQPGY